MNLNILKPKKALNKAFLKVKPIRTDIDNFKTQLIRLLDSINEAESEEFHKNLVSDFLKKTYYDPNHFINTKDRNDLVIHNGKDAKTSVGVIIEAKKPTNKTEMLRQDNINLKAFQELILYYLRERINGNNLEIRYLIATNIYEWFIFDANFFEKTFAHDKNLVSLFNDFEAGRLAGKTTEFFYKEIAEPVIAGIETEIEFTYFDIREYNELLRNENKQDDNKLIALFKLLSPEHLLKLPFINDSNSLDKAFYSELLHIIGLTEIKEGSKKLIKRKKEGEQNTGSLLENAILRLDSLSKIKRLEKPEQFGDTYNERLFNVALELSITWINRLLFLKLLEAQLISYHKGDKSFSFLNIDKIKNFDALNCLFFQVLARKLEDRDNEVKHLFAKIPYLNSSLFEPTELEHNTLLISNLKDISRLPIFSSTVLKDDKGRKRTGELKTLEYIFEFLDAYDFASEGSEEISEESKSLISASVLGLIFEKINGYKDGSFFTPGFITMYMCRETIRRKVLQKFNEAKRWNYKYFDDLYDKFEEREDRKEANEIVNSIRICDPAVGSGHFLVSALNEIIAIKSDLKILLDINDWRLKGYTVEVINDELVITDEDGDLFQYKPKGRETPRVQQAIFHEKKTIIENCLFGVDINSNSVQICRLRLWIELLKNAYYKSNGELETLPNLDINIKCGNSLISRFPLDADLKQTLKKSKLTIDDYKIAVQTYRDAANKEEKWAMEKLIADIRKGFHTGIRIDDPKRKRLNQLRSELFKPQLFKENADEKKAREQKKKKLEAEINKLSAEIENIKSSRIYDNAFEWRFEFPEALNDNGDFVGFDVVIGNPPYGVEYPTEYHQYFQQYYDSAKTINGEQKGSTDTFSLFIDKGLTLTDDNAMLSYIVPMSVASSESMTALHNMMFKMCESIYLSTYSNRPKKIFDNADQRVAIIICHKNNMPLVNLFTTKVNKRYTDTHINDIVKNLKYINSLAYVKFGRLPKVGSEIELSILKTLYKSKTILADLYENNGEPVYYRSAGGRYYNIVTNFPTGSTQEKSITVNKNNSKLIAAILSSNLYYWFLHIYSDNLHVKSYELDTFPIPIENFSKESIADIEEIYDEYLEDLQKNSKVKQVRYAHVSEYREYYARYSKHLIDKIDLAIQKSYGFTKEEIDFIINYDIEFRIANEE